MAGCHLCLWLITFVLIFIASLGTAQTPYEKGMRKAFELWDNNKMDEAANLFERIATGPDE